MKITNLLFITLIGLSFSSCSSDEKNDGPTDFDNSSYTLTIEGNKTYSNSWSLDSEEGAIVSIYSKNDDDQAISLIIADDPKDLSVNAAFVLRPSTQQPLPLGNLKTVEGDEPEHSYMVITIGETNYISNSGSAVLSNLKIKGLGEFTGFPSYRVEIDGKFDIVETDAVEQISIKGTVTVAAFF